jgi:hypothetical protein
MAASDQLPSKQLRLEGELSENAADFMQLLFSQLQAEWNAKSKHVPLEVEVQTSEATQCVLEAFVCEHGDELEDLRGTYKHAVGKPAKTRDDPDVQARMDAHGAPSSGRKTDVA